MKHNLLWAAACAAGALLYWAPASAADPPASPTAVVEQLLDKDMVGVPGKELLMLTVQYLPGAASLPHRHDAQVFVYVLEGEVIMQVKGSPAVTLHRGQTFYEGPNDVHVVSANRSKSAPAKILVFMVKDKNTPVSRGVAPQGAS
ncbi:MAG: cupin domain-containing protein [Steroidobacteraceae bacterium]|jgi:quercetin dioxygenase-like cupin family protein